MTETRQRDALDALLREWPEPPGDRFDADEMADRVAEAAFAAVASTTSEALSDAELFAAPLGQTDEERHNSAAPRVMHDPGADVEGERMSMSSSDRQRERRSLQDLAKLASLTPAPNSVRPVSQRAPAEDRSGEDSGLIDLSFGAAPASAAPVASAPVGVPASVAPVSGVQQAAPSSVSLPGPLLTRLGGPPPAPAPSVGSLPPGAFEQAARTSVVPASAPTSGVPAAPASVAPASVAPASRPIANATLPLPALAASQAASVARAVDSQSALSQLEPAKKGGKAGLVVGLLALVAAAAGGVVVMKNQAAEPTAPLVAQTTPAEAPAAEAPAEPAKADPAPVAVAEAEPTAPADDSFDPSQLPQAGAAHASKGAVVHAAPRANAKVAEPAPAAPAPVAKAAAPKKEEAKPAEPSGPAGSLGDAMRQAAGPGEQAATAEAKPTGPAAGTVPQKPSQGALTGALGAVLPAARSCLGPDDPVSKATVVFNNGGTVDSVTVSGNAAGKASGECIKTALSKAKVGAFAEPTYSAHITVRP